MKRSIVLGLLLILVLCACTKVEGNKPNDTADSTESITAGDNSENPDEWQGPFFTNRILYDRNDYTTPEKALLIKKGMTKDEIYSLLGGTMRSCRSSRYPLSPGWRFSEESSTCYFEVILNLDGMGRAEMNEFLKKWTPVWKSYRTYIENNPNGDEKAWYDGLTDEEKSVYNARCKMEWIATEATIYNHGEIIVLFSEDTE